MSQKFLTSIDLTKNELLNARIQNLGSAPSSPVVGQVYFDTGLLMLQIWNGSDWDVNVAKLAGQAGTYYLARGNHTGTQLAATISDFDTQVRTNRLDQMTAPTATVSMGSQIVSNVATPVASTDAANKGYVDAAINGVEIHPSVRVATTANITLSGAQTIDGVSVVATNRVLVKNQTAPEENGIYVAAAGAWSRAGDADSWAELVSAFVFVEEGSTWADTAWVSTVNAGGTLGVTAVTWTQFAAPGSITASNVGTGVGVYDGTVGTDLQFRSILAGSNRIAIALVSDDITINATEANFTLDNIGGTLGIAKGGTGQTTAAAALAALGGTKKYAASIGNNVLTTIAVTHSLGTTDVIVQVKEVGGGLAVVYPDIVITDINTVTLTFAVAPTTNQYRVIVIG